MFVRVRGEVEVERRDQPCTTPQAASRASETSRNRAQAAASLPSADRLAEVGLQQPLLGGLVEVVVDGEVAEVEVAVPDAGVLPVDQQDRARRSGSGCRQAGRRGTAPGRSSGSAGAIRSTSACARSIRPRQRAAARRERSPRRPAADPGSRSAPAARHRCHGRRAAPARPAPGRPAAASGSTGAPGTNAVTSAVAVGVEQLRADAQARGPLGREPLGSAVDPEQLGVLARKPQHAVAPAEAAAGSCGW